MARRKEILLGVLIVVGAVIFWKNFFGDGTVIGPGSRRHGAVGSIDYAAKKVFPVPWHLLTAMRPTYDPQGRNIFQFGRIAPPPAPKISPREQNAIDDAKRRAEAARLAALRKAQAAAKPPPPPVAPTRQTAPPPPAEPAKPSPPPIKYKFIGYLGPPQNKIAVLHDGTDMVFVSSGDELEEKFRVLDIGYESIKFGFLDPQFEQESRTLPMTSTP
jgi:hypothetical protein